MLQPRQQQWNDILQITEQLHQLSADDNWQAMSELEAERFDKLKDFFSAPVAEIEVDGVAKGIRKMMESDQELIQHSSNKQQEMSDGIKTLSKGRQATKAYSHFQK